MTDNSFQEALVREIGLFFGPIVDCADSKTALHQLFRNLGWQLDALSGMADLEAAFAAIVAAYEGINAMLFNPPDSLTDIQVLFDQADETAKAIRTLGSLLEHPGTSGAPPLDGLLGDLLNYLVVQYLRVHHPVAFHLGMVSTVLETQVGPLEPIVDDGTIIRIPSRLHKFHSSRLFDLLKDPVTLLRESYGSLITPGTFDEASARADQLFPRLAAVFDAMGANSLYGVTSDFEGNLGDFGNAAVRNMLTVYAPIDLVDEVTPNGFGISVAISPSEASFGNLGLVFVPFGTFHVSNTLGSWNVTADVELSSEENAFAYGPLGLTSLADSDGPHVRGTLLAEWITDREGEPIRLGGSTGTRLEIQKLQIEGSLLLEGQEADVGILLRLETGTLFVQSSEGDGFLQKIFPKEGSRADFSFAVGWSTANGFHFEGSGGFELRLPVHFDLGPIELQAITLAVTLDSTLNRIPIGIAVSAKAVLGPLTVVVENIGAELGLTFSDESSGNLGPVDIHVGLAGPTGIGLAIDSQGFKGGGFLSIKDGTYSGVLELEFQDWISLVAIGILTTRLPDSSKGYSLLIIIAAEFTPIQLGFGFTLNGVGGLLGLNRTVRVERLRAGLKDNTLNSILFPKDVVANANRIISDLQQIFPVQDDRFVFGPMAKIGWGSPTLITADLGLIIELPPPVRLIILGRLSAMLPDEDLKLLRLQVNFLGEIDLQAKRISFDAVLYDSSLLSFALAGDIALRILWGANSNFVLTVGGFHPDFQPPPLGIPALARLSLQLLDTDSASIRLETYFAVTSNTVQFGAKLELKAGSGKYGIYGLLAFDVLFQFDPFHFLADLEAVLALRAFGSEIASIRVTMSLDGPTPWHAKGTARLKLFWFLTVKIRFDKTFGETRQSSFPDVTVTDKLIKALNYGQNWSAEPPSGRHQMVNIKKIELGDGILLVHPFGTMTIRQNVVPLNVTISRFGNTRPADGNLFAITVNVGTEAEATTPVLDQFAPAQYFDMSDAEKLSQKSFDLYQAGVKFKDSAALKVDYGVKQNVRFELTYVDDKLAVNKKLVDPVTIDGAAFDTWAVGGAIAKSPLSHRARANSALAPGPVVLRQERFVVVCSEDLRPHPDLESGATETEAQFALKQILDKDPGLAGMYQVVPAFEVR